jgi:hypothetical protein
MKASELSALAKSASPLGPLLPRLIRFRDAPRYLGMDRNRFNAEVRPSLTEIPIGTQGIAFDRLELDAWVEQYKHRNGRPAQRKGLLKWDDKERQASSIAAASGTSISATEVDAFAKALASATSPKRRST